MPRFNFREKLEYLGLIWGTLVMTVTGFILWFEVEWLKYFPKWTFDVARTIHFYEAILATLTIIVWHFYSVFFNPDVYPMSWAWITGDLTEHEMEEEHGLELERIKAEEKGAPVAFREVAVDPGGRVFTADLIFMGPGSPTYAVRQLRGSLAWNAILARHRLGAAIALASAAVVAISTCALPVYEIYKVGEDLHWKPGLDLFGNYGLPLVFVPHWNNNDGGEELDTSRCFMGQARFIRLMEMRSPELTVVGIDEKTGLIIYPGDRTCKVVGVGGVILLNTGEAHPGSTDEQELEGTAP